MDGVPTGMQEDLASGQTSLLAGSQSCERGVASGGLSGGLVLGDVHGRGLLLLDMLTPEVRELLGVLGHCPIGCQALEQGSTLSRFCCSTETYFGGLRSE